MPCLPSFGSGLPGAPPGGSGGAGGSPAASSSCGSVSFPIPPNGTPGFAFSIPVLSIPFPSFFPEDLLCLFDLLNLQLPSGPLLPHLSLNFGKDVFDAIMKLLDQFMPFLMLYKFFLPILNLIICIIEVLCALMNPFALIGALDRLFTQCIPAFLALFPIFALIIMIISLLLLLLALIEYIIQKIIQFILAILRNINALIIAFETGNAVGVLAVANKLASLLCIFQNIFVLLALFGIIIQVIKDILGMLFAIPPCEGGSNSNCCSPLTCPAIAASPSMGTEGSLLYTAAVAAPITGFTIPGFPQPTFALRPESWQIWDPNQEQPTRFWDISQAQDVIDDGYNPPPVFFPTGSTFSATTPPSQAAYTVDVRLQYNPADWGRTGAQQYVRFKQCIVLNAPTQSLQLSQGGSTNIPNGVLYIAGGSGFLDDGSTPLDGYQADGVTPLSPTAQASLETFFHKKDIVSSSPVFDDGYTFNSTMGYTFNPNLPILLQANLVTAGCQPQIQIARAFVNNTMFSNIAVQTAGLKNLVNSPPSALGFPDPSGAQQCLSAAVATLRTNMTTQGVSDFQAMANLCLSNLQQATKNALNSTIGIGYSPCNSSFTLDTSSQFTTLPITVTAQINENNGLTLTKNLPSDVGANIAAQIKGYPTFGTLSNFAYDGYQAFTAQLTADTSGAGSLMVAFENQVMCVNNIPADGSPPTHVLQTLDYDFTHVPTLTINLPPTGEGDTVGDSPRRDPTTAAKDGGGD